MKDKLDISAKYAVEITELLSQLFDEDSEHCLDLEKLQEGDNATHFLHALANLVPRLIYIKLTHDDVDIIKFNHIANRLIFQYHVKNESND